VPERLFLAALILSSLALAHGTPDTPCDCEKKPETAGAEAEPPAPEDVASGEDTLNEEESDESYDPYSDEEYDGAQGPVGFQYQFAARQDTAVADSPVKVVVDQGAPSNGTGFAPLHVSLRNGSNAPQEIRLSYRDLARGESIARVTRTVGLARGERAQVMLPIPAGRSYGELEVQPKGFAAVRTPVSLYGSDQAAILSVGKQEDFEKVVRQKQSVDEATATVRSLPPDELPDQLAAYVGYSAVVLSQSPLESLPEAQRRALEVYAATGGVLVLPHVTRGSPAHLPLLDSEEPGLHRYGFGWVRLCSEDAVDCAFGIRDDANNFGLTVVPRTSPVPRGGRPSLSRLMAMGGAEGDDYDYDYDDIGGENRRQRVARDNGLLLPQAVAPLGRVLVIIGLFLAVIGPGSVYVARKKSSLLLLLTVPGTALVTIALIIVYSVFGEGFATHASSRSVTLLDGEHGRAISAGTIGFYANLPQRGASFGSSESVFFPSDAVDVSMDWTNGGRIGDGFLPARIYREWGMVSVHPSRSRLRIRRAGDALFVQNALGGKVGEARLMVDGQLWRVAALDDGQELQAESVTAHLLTLANRDEYRSRLDAMIERELDDPLEEGEFHAQVAVTDALPLRDVEVLHHDSETLMIGRVER
jgi:hypothetical protein